MEGGGLYMWQGENKKIKELLEQYVEDEIRNSEIMAERKENQFEPSEEFKNAMGQMFEDVPKYMKTLRCRKLQSQVVSACAVLAKTAAIAVLLVIFSGGLSGKRVFTASVNQIMQNTKNVGCLSFLVDTLRESDELKSVSKLIFEFQYIPDGYELAFDELISKPEVKAFHYVKGADSKFSVYVARLETVGDSFFIMDVQKYSMFQAGTEEVIKIKGKDRRTVYVWVQSGYLFVLSSTEDLQEEMGQIIASINIS